MTFIYCKTLDNPKRVGETICRANSVSEQKEQPWIIKDETEDGSYTIKNSCKHFSIAIVYSVGNSVIGIEVDDECASKVIEPLIETYGFEKVKWLTST